MMALPQRTFERGEQEFAALGNGSGNKKESKDGMKGEDDIEAPDDDNNHVVLLDRESRVAEPRKTVEADKKQQ